MHWPVIRDPQTIFVIDFVRGSCLVGCALLAAGSLALLFSHDGRLMSHWQRARFLSLVFGALFIAGTELGQIHHPIVIWRLPLAVTFIGCALHGVWGMRNGLDRVTERKKALHD